MKRELLVQDRVRVPRGLLGQATLELLAKEFTYENPERAEWERGLRVTAAPPQTIASWRIDEGDWMSFPRGGLERVVSIIGPGWEENDVTSEGFPTEIPRHRVELWEFQEQMTRAAIARRVCLMRAPPGSGKTTACLALASRLQLSTLVIVWTGSLLKQWLDRCVVELGMRREDVGVIEGTGRHRIGPITIGMQQTLANHVDKYADQFGLVIADEVQRFASETFNDVIDKMEAMYRVGVSADERRADQKEFLIYDQFGGVAYDVDRSELQQQGRILDVEVRVVPTGMEARWYKDLQIRAHSRGAGWAIKREMGVAFNRMLAQMASDKNRNALILELAREHVEAGDQVAVLSHRREHCSELASDLDRVTNGRGGILLGGKGDHEGEFDRAKRGLKDGSVRAAAATYQAFGTGVDVPSLGVGIFATPVANAKKGRMQFDQYLGRFARATEGKTRGVVYYLWDELVYGKSPLKNIASWGVTATIRHDGAWVPLKDYLKQRKPIHEDTNRGRAGAAEEPIDDGTGGLFVSTQPAPRRRTRSDVRS